MSKDELMRDLVEQESTRYQFERLSTHQKHESDQLKKEKESAQTQDPYADKYMREAGPEDSAGDSMQSAEIGNELPKWLIQASMKRDHGKIRIQSKNVRELGGQKKQEHSQDIRKEKGESEAEDESRSSVKSPSVTDDAVSLSGTDKPEIEEVKAKPAKSLNNRPVHRETIHSRGGIGSGGGLGQSTSLPKITPKGAGQGSHPMESFSHSGLSYQLEHYGELGKNVTGDIDESRTQIQKQLPGDGTQKIDDGKGKQFIQQAAQKTKSSNQHVGKKSIKSLSSSNTVQHSSAKTKSRIESQKRQTKRGKTNQLPVKPTVSADMSVIEQSRTVEAEKFATAQAEGAERVSNIDRTLPERDFGEVKTPSVELSELGQGIETSKLPGAKEIAELDDEAKGLLDISEIAEPASAQMQVASEKVDDAKLMSQQATEAKITEHHQAIEKTKADANLKEQNLLEQKKSELDRQLTDESNRYEQEITAYDEAQQKDIEDAKNRIEQERTKAQSSIDSEHAKADAEKQKAEAESKDDKSLAEKAVDWMKTQAERLKNRICTIIAAVQEEICRVLDNFVVAVSAINKDLGDKLQKSVNKLKEALDSLSKRLIEIANNIIDAVVKEIEEIAEALVTAIHILADALKMAIDAIVEGLKAAYHDVIELAKSILNGLGDICVAILRKACEFAGMDPEIIIDAAKKIVHDPKGFFKTLWAGIKEGGSNFIKNFGTNALIMLRNLFSLWLAPVGITIPESIPSLAGFIELGLNVIGIDVLGILSKLERIRSAVKDTDEADTEAENTEEEEKSTEAFSDGSDLDKVLAAIKTGGISILLDYILPSLQGIDTEIIKTVISELVPSLITKGLTKLAMMANPATGIISAIKGAWDLIQFFRERFEAIKGLVTAITNVLVKCANGDSSAVAGAFEATLCQVIPVAVDLFLRLINFDIGSKIRKIITKVGGKIRKVIDNFIGKFNKKTGTHLKTSKERAKREEEKAKKYEENKRKRELLATQGNNKEAKRGVWGDKTSTRIAQRRARNDKKVWDITGAAGAFRSEKIGNFGLNASNSEYVQAIDARNNSKNLHKRLEKAGGDPSKLSRADQKALWEEKRIQSAPDYQEKSLKETWKGIYKQHKKDRKEEKEKHEEFKAKHPGRQKKANNDTRLYVKDNLKTSKIARESSNIGYHIDAEARRKGITAVKRMNKGDAARYEAWWNSKQSEIEENERLKEEEASHVITLSPEELEEHRKRGEDIIAASYGRGQMLREKYRNEAEDNQFDADVNIPKRAEIQEARAEAKANGWVLRDNNGGVLMDKYGAPIPAWPENSKQYDAVPGTQRKETIEPGMIISRYSYSQYDAKDRKMTSDEGTYFSPDGVSKESRAMSPSDAHKPEYRFKVLKPISVESSYATPWFDTPGLGKQYNSGNFEVYDKETGQMAKATMKVLLRNGYIERID